MKHLPNTITLCNLLSGCVATFFALNARFDLALVFIIVGAVFDFFDGFAARLLHVSSPLGKELDSLADDITFGFAPAAIVFSMLRLTLPAPLEALGAPAEWAAYLSFFAFLIAAFSALRLAKFNLDERQTTSFIGLPTPANALFWAALAVGLQEKGLLDAAALPYLLLLGILLSSYLLVAEIPMFALKFKSFKWQGNALRYSFILLSLALLLVLGFAGFSAVIVLYILTSVASNLWSK
ncbi:MAG: CDP-alcohol phosphatidyltransferase family protein [Alloprevotella sp.]